MPLYATLQQYRDWSGDQSAELTQRDLTRASRLITAATAGAVYTTDSNGLPTNTATLAALREATLEVLSARAPAETASGELAELARAGVQSASINGASYTLRADVKTDASTGLPWEAHQVLLTAGLLATVVVYG